MHIEVLATLEHYNHIIEGLPVTVQTDHRNLKWLMDMKEPTGRLGRWVLRLQRHRFDVEYRQGKANELADALSRLPLKEDNALGPFSDFYGDTSEREVLLVQLTEQVNGSAHYELEFSDLGVMDDSEVEDLAVATQEAWA